MKCKLGTPYLLYTVIGAILTALTLVFPRVGFLEWITMIPLFLGVYRMGTNRSIGLVKAYFSGFFTVLAYYLIIYYWFFSLYPLDFVGMDNASSVVVVLAGWIGLSLLQAIPGGLVFLIYKLLHRTPVFQRAPLLRPFAFAALWVVFEWSSTLGWTGVPWGRLALGQIEYLPMLGAASLFGSYFVGLLILLCNGLLAYAILARRRHLRAVLCTSLALLIVISNFTAGALLLRQAETPEAEAVPLRVAVVQGNISSHDKWSAESVAITCRVYGEMTREAGAAGAELILWPETAFPYVLTNRPDLCVYLSSLARECDVTLVVGALSRDEAGREYNALYLISPDGTISEDTYAKRHLVPFGEYVPIREVITALISPLSDLSALQNDLTPGADSALFDTEWGKLGGLICFDSIYEELSRDSVRDGAGLLLLSSNDSWFLDSAAIYQHEGQARLRAIENGRYLVRAGNTGISTVITPAGENLEWIDPLVKGWIIADVEVRSGETLYTRTGDLIVPSSMAFLLLLVFLSLIPGDSSPRKIKKRGN